MTRLDLTCCDQVLELDAVEAFGKAANPKPSPMMSPLTEKMANGLVC